MNEEPNHTPEGNSAIVGVYMLLLLATVCLFTPIVPVFMTGMIVLPLTLLAAWVLRLNKNEDSPIYSHMIYISRTIWIFSFIMSLTTSIAGFAVFGYADNTVYTEMINNMMNGVAYSPQESFDILIQYIQINLPLMVGAGLFCLIPTAGYIAYRLHKGFSRALKGYRLSHPKAWF